ncbi:MAG: hypothetical protein RQ826_03700 [Xanthomonadales bacterium]|nr:hypothetical protein [Xanthomonadales bacterium]
MKTLAVLLIVIAFLAGSFLSVLDPREVAWNYFLLALAPGLIGLWIYRKARQEEARASDKLTGNMEILGSSLDNIRTNLAALCERRHQLPVYQARFEIDHLFRADLNRFAAARESMIHVFGMQDYADVMSNFAAGERYINRVWSASTDGYVDEVHKYLKAARSQFEKACEHFHALKVEL